MDKADFTFIVASFCYLVLTLVCRSGYLYMEVLDVAGIVLWGILMITTLVKARFYLEHVGRKLATASVAVAIALFLMSILIPIINPVI